MTIQTISGRPVGQKKKRLSDDELDKLAKKKNAMTRGIFRCHEPRNGEVTLVWKEFKNEPLRRITLKDGEEYEIPVGLAEHINQNCTYYEHSRILDAQGNPSINKKGKPVSRMNFESMQFYGE